MRNYKLIIAILAIIALYSCGFKQEIEINPRYYVIQVDIPDDKDICYKLDNGDYIGIIGGGLSKLYQKGDTLIAIKAITKGEFPMENCYIVPLHADNILDPSIGVKGPLTKTELTNELTRNGTDFTKYREIDIR